VASEDNSGEDSPSGEPSRYQVPAGSLKARLAQDMRAALKAGEKVRLSTLRLLSAAVTNREVELGHPVTDEEFLSVANREVKRRREAIEAYTAAGREDRAATEQDEQHVLEAYLPAGLSEQEVDALIEEAVVATGAGGPADLGKVMGLVMAKAKGRVDGKLVQSRVRSRLGA
jgi:uncharacterized protein YqeY